MHQPQAEELPSARYGGHVFIQDQLSDSSITATVIVIIRMRMTEAQYTVDGLAQVKNRGRRWESDLSYLCYGSRQKVRRWIYEWEAELNWSLPTCAWWGVSDGAFIGQAWKIIFPEGQISHYPRIGKSGWKLPLLLVFFPFSFLTHKKEIWKMYRWQVGYPHGNKTLPHSPFPACCGCMPEWKQRRPQPVGRHM